MAQSLPVQHSLKGTLNLDTDPANIQQGNYCDAKNVQFIGRGVGGTLPISPVLRNELMASMGSVASQRKLVRVFFDLNTPYVFRFLSPGGAGQLRNSALSSGIVIQDITVNAVSYAAAASFLQGVLQNTYSFASSVIAGSNFIEIDLVGAFQLDWSVVSVGANQFTTEIRREAIPNNYTGTLSLIGGHELLGDLFLFATPQERLPREIGGCSVISGPGGLVQIVFPTPHGLTNGDEIFIQNGSNDVNGYWLVNVINPSNVSLRFSSFVAGGLCDVVLDRRGVGEIGVAVQDNATKVWTYTRLLRSIEFGFSTLRQVEVQAENSILGRSLYFHQVKYNPPRVFYYRGDYIQDGSLSFVSSANQYSYGDIANETQAQLNVLQSNLSLSSVDVTGGRVKAGNKVYFIRLLTSEDALVGSDWHAFTNIINIYSANQFGSPAAIVGDTSGTETSKLVRLTLSNIPNSLYGFVELGVAEFFGSAVQFGLIRREEIIGSQMELIHTGSETVSPLSTAEVLFIQRKIQGVGTERILDNRLLYFDVEYLADIDLSEWASSFTHRIRRFSNELIPNTGQDENVVFGAYMNPIITETKLGYSWFETYRFACRVYWKTGSVSADFWIDDIRFDALTDNIYSNPGQSRRVGPYITDYDLDFGPNQFYAPSVEFGNIDLNYLVDGVPLKNLINKIEIRRVDMESNPSYREILCSGPSIVAVTGFVRSTNFKLSPTFAAYGNTSLLPGIGAQELIRHPFPFFAGQEIAPGVPTSTGINNYTSSNGFFAPGANSNLSSAFRSKTTDPLANSEHQAFMFSNDIIFGKRNIVFSPGDQVIRFGTMNSLFPRFYQINKDLASWERDFRCEFSSGTNVSFYPIEDAKVLFRGTQDFLLNSQVPFATYAYSRKSASPNLDPFSISPTYSWETALAYSVDLSSIIFDNFGNPNEGVFYSSYYRQRFYQVGNPDNSKFGRRDESRYVSTNSFLDVDISTNTGSIIVFGGDTFISRTQLKLCNHNEEDTSFDFSGSSFAMAFTSQSNVNPYMRRVVDSDPAAAFPAKPLEDQGSWLENELLDQTEYDVSYNQRQVNSAIGYKPPVADESKFPTRIIWSNLKPEGSFADSYREFPPLNFKDLNRIFGRIVHAEVVNNELFVLQERKWQREFFNTTGLVSASPDDAIALGNTGVLSRKGVGLSAYGTRHKWSAIRGRLASGADCVCWMDVENGTIVRYGGDGTRSISFPSGVDQFFKENSEWVFEHDTPAAGLGICGVWNERFKEFRWAVRGFRRPDIDPWTARVNIPVGATVRVPGSGYEPVRLKECIQAHESSSINNPVTGASRDLFWRDVLLTDGRHYNIYSLVYSEAKNGFTTFLEPVPRVMLPWRADYVTQKYGDFNNRPLFLENNGLDGWYDVDGTPLIADGFIEAVINYNSDQIKQFTALYVDCELVPYRVEFTTPEQESFLVDTDFTYREGVWVSPIKNDILTSATGSNEDDTTRLYGRWIKVKIWFESGKMQTLRNFRVRLEFSARYVQT